MASSRSEEATLRLQFGTAANTVGAQLYAVEKTNGGNARLHRRSKPRLIAFEAKDRIHRKVSATQAIDGGQSQRDLPNAWDGGVQVYDQAPVMSAAPSTSLPSSAYWSWEDFSDKNLFEIGEFRPHMALHNVCEGQSTSRGGSLSLSTMDAIEDRLRGVLEETDSLRLVENHVDLDSSWAGLSVEVLTYFSEECPSAVVATFGNDWNYPLTDQSDENIYGAELEIRDKAKIEARRGINLLTSVAMLIESSSVFIPVALSGSSRRFAISSSKPELLSAATYAATAIEIVMSEFRAAPSASINSLLEGILPSMKVLEVSVRFPFNENPTALIDETTSSSTAENSAWDQHSLIPRHTQARARGLFDATMTSETIPQLPPRFRRVHFRGEFAAHAPAFQGALARFGRDRTVAQWTHEPLYIERLTRIEAVDAVSQLTLSHAVGGYLNGLATRMNRNDRRVLYEFTEAGLDVDAVAEFQDKLGTMSEAYP